jgi:hypothetical protein
MKLCRYDDVPLRQSCRYIVALAAVTAKTSLGEPAGRA